MNKKNISLLHRKKRSITKISESNNVDVLQQNNVDVNNNTIETSTTKISESELESELESDIVDVLQQNNNDNTIELVKPIILNSVDVFQTNNIKKIFILNSELKLKPRSNSSVFNRFLPASCSSSIYT